MLTFDSISVTKALIGYAWRWSISAFQLLRRILKSVSSSKITVVTSVSRSPVVRFFLLKKMMLNEVLQALLLAWQLCVSAFFEFSDLTSDCAERDRRQAESKLPVT